MPVVVANPSVMAALANKFGMIAPHGNCNGSKSLGGIQALADV